MIICDNLCNLWFFLLQRRPLGFFNQSNPKIVNRHAVLFLMLMASIGIAIAQSPSEFPFTSLKQAKGKITLDGELAEADWFTGVPVKDFWQYFPQDTGQAIAQTEIYMTYDEENLYIGVKCWAAGNDYVVRSLKRDYRAGGNDNITFLFDTYYDQTNAFIFGLNPYGVQREGVIANGGQVNQDFSTSWDNKWYSSTKRYDGYWIGELAIPFKTLRFKNGETKWRFNSYRFDTQSNERSSWIHIPREQNIYGLAFMGDMIWDKPLKKPGANVAFIPFLSGSATKSHIDGDQETGFAYGAGGDAKIGVTPGLNLDLTVNPDFSQVEVDRQVTNLDRFEIFFPERRQFFVENADLFGSFGNSRINPFFSRRIGVAQDTATGVNIQNPILFGARLSGKLDNNWRIGVLNMQTDKDEDNGLASLNYGVLAVQRKLFARSNLSFIAVNKQALHEDSSKSFTLLPATYNRVFGVDYAHATVDNKWAGKVFYHRSFTPEKLEKGFAHGGLLTYRLRNLRLTWEHSLVGEGYDAEVGFVPRTGFSRINPEVNVFFYPKGGFINQHGPQLETSFIWTPEDGKTDHRIEGSYDFRFQNTGSLRFTVENRYTYLFSAFDPTRTDGPELPEGSEYTYTSFRVSYRSDSRKRFSFSVNPRAGQYFNGHRIGGSGDVTYRYQPYGSISVNANFNRIILPDSFSTANLLLIGPRIDFTINKSLFFTGFFQYNNQVDNFNINARLQWRFKPVSDFFLVYTENYYSSDFKVKSRALVAKLTYWLNL